MARVRTDWVAIVSKPALTSTRAALYKEGYTTRDARLLFLPPAGSFLSFSIDIFAFRFLLLNNVRQISRKPLTMTAKQFEKKSGAVKHACCVFDSDKNARSQAHIEPRPIRPTWSEVEARWRPPRRTRGPRSPPPRANPRILPTSLVATTRASWRRSRASSGPGWTPRASPRSGSSGRSSTPGASSPTMMRRRTRTKGAKCAATCATRG